MRQAIVTAFLLPLAVFIANAATADTSQLQCDNADTAADVTLKFCSWQTDGVWHVSPKVKNGANKKKSITVKCSPPGTSMANIITDAYEPGDERIVFDSKLPTATERPSSYCKLDSVEDFVPSNAGRAEEQ